MPAGLGPMTRVVTERLPNLSAPLTRALVAICPETWKMGQLAPKYPDLNRTNEHRYIIVLVKALFSRESSGTSRSLLPSTRTFEGLDWISQVAKPFASTPPSSPCSWLKWWVISPYKARLSKRHGFSVPLSRTSAPSRSSLALALTVMAPLPFSVEEPVGELTGIC